MTKPRPAVTDVFIDSASAFLRPRVSVRGQTVRIVGYCAMKLLRCEDHAPTPLPTACGRTLQADQPFPQLQRQINPIAESIRVSTERVHISIAKQGVHRRR